MLIKILFKIIYIWADVFVLHYDSSYYKYLHLPTNEVVRMNLEGILFYFIIYN